MHAVAVLKLKGVFRKRIAAIVLHITDTENPGLGRERSWDEVTFAQSFGATQNGDTLTVQWTPTSTGIWGDQIPEPTDEISELFFSVLPQGIRYLTCIGTGGRHWSFERTTSVSIAPVPAFA